VAKKETFTPIWNYKDSKANSNEKNPKGTYTMDSLHEGIIDHGNTPDSRQDSRYEEDMSSVRQPKAQKMFEEYKPKTAEARRKQKRRNTLMLVIVILLMLILIVAIVFGRTAQLKYEPFI